MKKKKKQKERSKATSAGCRSRSKGGSKGKQPTNTSKGLGTGYRQTPIRRQVEESANKHRTERHPVRKTREKRRQKFARLPAIQR